MFVKSLAIRTSTPSITGMWGLQTERKTRTSRPGIAGYGNDNENFVLVLSALAGSGCNRLRLGNVVTTAIQSRGRCPQTSYLVRYQGAPEPLDRWSSLQGRPGMSSGYDIEQN
jgi:hypothetical protein